MTEEKKKTLERAENAIFIHLDVLCGDVEAVEGHVKNHLTIDGIKDCTKALKNIMEIKMMDSGNSAPKQPAATVSVVK